MSNLKSEFKRKALHVIFAIYFFAYYAVLNFTKSKTIATISLLTIFLILLVIEYIRTKQKIKIPVFQNLWRKEEQKKFGGEIYYMISIIILTIFFEFKIAAIAILMLAFGDSAATLIGLKFGKHKIKSSKKKTSIEGSITELIVNLIIGFTLWQNWIIIPMAITATLTETYIAKLDDNLTIPIITALVGTILNFL